MRRLRQLAKPPHDADAKVWGDSCAATATRKREVRDVGARASEGRRIRPRRTGKSSSNVRAAGKARNPSLRKQVKNRYFYRCADAHAYATLEHPPRRRPGLPLPQPRATAPVRGGARRRRRAPPNSANTARSYRAAPKPGLAG